MAWASVSFSRSAWAVMIPGRASCLIILTAVSPHPHLIPSPITISKRKPGKQAGGGRITSAIASWLANENKQARRERRTASPPSPSSHGATVSPSHATSHQSPRPHDKHTTRRETRRRNERTDKTNMGTTRTTDGRRNENARAPQDDKQATRRRARRPTRRRRQGQKQAV